MCRGCSSAANDPNRPVSTAARSRPSSSSLSSIYSNINLFIYIFECVCRNTAVYYIYNTYLNEFIQIHTHTHTHVHFVLPHNTF